MNDFIELNIYDFAIILFYTCKYIVNKYIRMIAILLFTVCLSLAITLGFGFNFIEYILTIFLIIIFIELIELDIYLKRN